MNLIEFSDANITALWNDYAEKRNKGLKKKANEKLKELVEYLQQKTEEEQRAFVEYLCIEKFEKENINQFQQPIIEGVILPVMIQAVEKYEMPYLRWIYQLELYSYCNYKNIINVEYYNSEQILLDANKVDPSDMKTVDLLLDMYMNSLWFGSHHLPEYILIEEERVNELLEKINGIINQYNRNIDNVKSILGAINYYKDLYESWFRYNKENKDNSFLEWCIENGKEYRWVKAYYYNKQNK